MKKLDNQNLTPPLPQSEGGTADSLDNALEQGPYVEGFTGRTVLGALFVAFVMMPGSIYLGLVAGQSLGPAAEWVTVILFAELSRRSFTRLRRQEIFILFYVASSLAAVALAHLALAGGPFAGAIWNQYLVQSPQTQAIANQIPDWVVPPMDSPGVQKRNLAHPDWWWSLSRGMLSPVLLIVIGQILGRMSWLGMGYLLFRLTSDVERLPFPLAPVAAEGATALAESTDREEGYQSRRKKSWRWNAFSFGACLGIVFGLIYVCLPVCTGLFMAKPVMVLPIPFIDFTSRVEGLLPASLISVSFDASLFLAGMILPFPLVMGTFTAILLTSVFGNPILAGLGYFQHWHPGNGLLVNQMILSFDFWMSVALGLAAAVALIGLYSVTKNSLSGVLGARKNKTSSPAPILETTDSAVPYRTPCKQRGDFPVSLCIGLIVASTICYIWVSHLLVPEFPVWIIVIFGFVWTPLQSYVSARLVGITGTGITTPFLKETVFIVSGYKGVDIWFAPIPLADYGAVAQRFRELELTRTRFTSILKAELLMLPISLVSSFLFWWLFWSMNQVPAESFPYATRTWPVAARQTYLILTANSSEQPLLLQALKIPVIVGSFGVGMVVYFGLWLLGLPLAFFYGLIGGVGAPLHGGLPLILGALLGRFYFKRKFGETKWSRMIPVVAAGFACGMGLSGMLAVASAIVSQCTRELPF